MSEYFSFDFFLFFFCFKDKKKRIKQTKKNTFRKKWNGGLAGTTASIDRIAAFQLFRKGEEFTSLSLAFGIYAERLNLASKEAREMAKQARQTDRQIDAEWLQGKFCPPKLVCAEAQTLQSSP
jgi:hypothetical protein